MKEKTDKSKIIFSKEQKRRALLEFAKGKSQREIFETLLGDSREFSCDKKYFAKLLHKWRQEMYKNKQILNFQSQNLDDNLLNYEISNISGLD